MIKSLIQGGSGRYLTVSNGWPGSNYMNNFSGAQGLGNMRFNTTQQAIEIYDGQMWVPLKTNDAYIQLTEEAESLLNWARKKRDEEITIEAFASTNTAVKIALDNLKKAKEQLDVTIILSKEHNESTS